MAVKKVQIVEGDVKIRQHLPNRLAQGQGPLALAKECMELSNKIQVLTDDYIFCTMFMQYVKLKDPALYKQGRLTAESVIKQSSNVPKEETSD